MTISRTALLTGAWQFRLAASCLVSALVWGDTTWAEPQAAPAPTAAATAAPPALDHQTLFALASAAEPVLRHALAELERSAPSPNVAPGQPAALVATWRQQGGTCDRVCVKVLHEPPAMEEPLLNPWGVVRDRIGGEMLRPAGEILGMLYAPVQWWGDPATVGAQNRAFELSWRGDITLLREQTVEPIDVLVVVPRADRFLPASLQDRVDQIIVKARLTFGEWAGNMELVAPHERAARQVADIIGGWRDLALGLARSSAAGAVDGQHLIASLDAIDIQRDGRKVRASVRVPSTTIVRVSKELAGHAPPDKVAVCHRGRTLYVAPAAVSAHLAHGDTLGPCAGDGGGKVHGNNGLGNGPDPQPPGNPPPNDVPGI